MSSILDTINKDRLPSYQAATSIEGSDIFDVTRASFKEMATNRTPYHVNRLLFNKYEKRARDYKKVTGEDLGTNPYAASRTQKNPFRWAAEELDLVKGTERLIENQETKLQRAREEIGLVLPSAKQLQDELIGVAVENQSELQSVLNRANAFESFFGQFAGGLAAGFSDPVNLGLSIFGAPAGAGIMRTFVTEAGINAGIEAFQAPEIAKWQKTIGNEYGLGDAALQVGFGALMGGGFAAGIKGAPMAGSAVFRALADVGSSSVHGALCLVP
jgi:hypothetical protein